MKKEETEHQKIVMEDSYPHSGCSEKRKKDREKNIVEQIMELTSPE